MGAPLKAFVGGISWSLDDAGLKNGAWWDLENDRGESGVRRLPFSRLRQRANLPPSLPSPLPVFSKFNPTSATVMLDRSSGRSRGFGFVFFRAQADMDAAVAELHATEVDGRRVSVGRSSPRPACRARH